MAAIKVLLISDDLEAGEMLAFGLHRRSMEVALLDDLAWAVEQWRTQAYALAIVNESNTSLDGVDLCEQLRQEATMPLLLLTYNRDERYGLQAYQAGVDECIVKPIGMRLLMAKVIAWLQRTGRVPTDLLSDVAVNGLTLDTEQRQLLFSYGKAVKLSNLEIRLLHLLMSHPGVPLGPGVIVKYVWGYQGEDDANLLKHVIYRLRRKIEPDPAHPTYVLTVVGEGYLFDPGY